MYTLGLYEKAMPNHLSMEDKLTLTKKSGFDFMEMSIDETDEKLARLFWNEEDVRQVIDSIQRSGVQIGSICLSAHRKYPLGSEEESTREKSLDIMKRAIDLANQLSVRIIQLAGYDVYYEQSTMQTKQRFLDNLKISVEYASQNGVILGFETMENEFMDTVKKAMGYIDRVNSPYLQLYPDLGNLTNAAQKNRHDLQEDIRLGKGHIVAMHLKETAPNVYRDMFYGKGHVDFAENLTLLKSMKVNRFVAEFWDDKKDNYEKRLKDASIFLRNVIENEVSND